MEKCKKGDRVYYEQVGSNAKIIGTIVKNGNKLAIKRDRKVDGTTWHDNLDEIQRDVYLLKSGVKCSKR